MTAASRQRDAPARRLLAALVDEQALETEPIGEVRADLAALGIDPSRTIALSGRLAAGTASPAAALLHRIAESEEGDDELRQVERAAVADVREHLPAGATAAAIASAQRAAGRDSNVVGLRRRRARRFLYGMSGVAAALAASLVLYVGLSTQPVPYPPGQQAAERRVTLSDTEAEEGARFRRESDQAIGDSARSAAEPVPATPQLKSSEDVSGDRLQALNQPAASGAQTLSAPPSEGAGLTAGLRDEAQVAADLRRLAAEDRIAAFLVVTPDLLPDELKQADYPSGDLPGRLDEARRVAAGRPVAALATLHEADRSYDAAIVAHWAPSESAAEGEYLYGVIELPSR
jgi:hypothetical protein